MEKEEALKILRDLHDKSLFSIRTALETLIPELAESEDERIRKFLIDILSSGTWRKEWPFSPVDCVAYLEKQKAKEQYNRMAPIYNNLDSFESALDKAWKSYNDCGSRIVDSCEDDYVECAHAKGFREGYLFGIEKQKGQKPNFDIHWENGSMVCEQKEPKPVEKNLDEFVEFFTKRAKAYEINLPNRHYDIYAFCKDLYLFVPKQKPAEWSEEDEKMLDEILDRVTYAFYNQGLDGEIEDDPVFLWLHKLRPNWKPSEEQMAALKRAVNKLAKTDVADSVRLSIMYDNLKKL